MCPCARAGWCHSSSRKPVSPILFKDSRSFQLELYMSHVQYFQGRFNVELITNIDTTVYLSDWSQMKPEMHSLSERSNSWACMGYCRGRSFASNHSALPRWASLYSATEMKAEYMVWHILQTAPQMVCYRPGRWHSRSTNFSGNLIVKRGWNSNMGISIPCQSIWKCMRMHVTCMQRYIQCHFFQNSLGCYSPTWNSWKLYCRFLLHYHQP